MTAASARRNIATSAVGHHPPKPAVLASRGRRAEPGPGPDPAAGEVFPVSWLPAPAGPVSVSFGDGGIFMGRAPGLLVVALLALTAGAAGQDGKKPNEQPKVLRDRVAGSIHHAGEL